MNAYISSTMVNENLRVLKLLSLSVILCTGFTQTTAQFKVTNCKKAMLTNGSNVAVGQDLKPEDVVIIGKNGSLLVSYHYWAFAFNEGKHKLDSMLDEGRKFQDFRIADTIYNVLSDANLLSCKEIVRCNHAPAREQITGDGKIVNRAIYTTGDFVNLRLTISENPTPGEKYYWIFKTLFDDYVHFEVTTVPELNLDLRPMKKHSAVIYKIVTSNCFTTEEFLIKMGE